jgi:hypothetical protein
MTYDSNKEDAFLVHVDNVIIKFECSPDGLYQYLVSKGYQQSLKEDQKEDVASNLTSTLAKKRQGYTLRQFEQAKEARRLYHIAGTPTVNNFKLLLWMNAMQNCPVTVEGVSILEKIFGPGCWQLLAVVGHCWPLLAVVVVYSEAEVSSLFNRLSCNGIECL